MGAEQTILVQLLVKIAVLASMASIALRWSFAKRMLLREQRTIQQRLELGLLFGVVFASGTMVRLVLKYDAAEVGLEGAFVAGLVGGYVPGLVAGGLISLPSALLPQHEWVAIPLLIGVGALGGLLRNVAPGPEEIWRFSPFFPFAIPSLLRMPTTEGAFQGLLLFTSIFIEFLRTSLALAFSERGWLFSLLSRDGEVGLLTTVLVYVTTVISIGVTLKVWNNTRNEWKLEEQQRLLMQARLRNLASQINPHFLFNTLNSISSLIRSNQNTARELVVKLSTILRRLLRQQDAFTPLRDELAFIEDYLEIEQVRFGAKLHVYKELDAATLDALVPSMLLQPLVENSIKHGISSKIEGGSIWLRSARRGSWLQIEVEDDGVGVPEEILPVVFQTGIGIGNVHERLSVLFGSDFQMTIENRQGGGTRVRIQFPELRDTRADAPADRSQVESVRA
jgi:two-component system LytT family sensor kinase